MWFDNQRPFWYATLLLICVAAFFLTALISQGIFERVPHVDDEAAYLFQAQVFATGRLSVPTPPYPESYWSPFVLDYQGQRFGKYPPGYPLLLSLGVRAGQPWVVNALLASLTLWLVAHLGREIYSPAAGLLAATLGLTCPVFLAESSSLLSHPTSLFFTTLFLWAFAKLIRETGSQSRYAALVGLAWGWLIITRPYDAIGASLPFALYGLARGLRGDRAMLSQGAIATAIALLFGLSLSAYWYWLIRDFANPYGLVWPYDRPGFGPNVGLKGYTLATGLSYVRYNLNALASGFLGWPGYLNIIFLWLPFVFRPHDRWNYLLLAGFASVVNLHLTYWYYGGHDAGYPRYYYAALPMLLLLTARGIEVLSLALQRLSYRARRFFEQGASRMIPPLARLAVYLILIALTLYNGLFSLPMRLSPFQGKSGITAAPLQVVRDAGMTNVLVFVADYEYWFDFAVFFSANSPTLDSDVVYAIYQNEQQARGVTGLYPHRRCYVQRQNRLLPCPF
ncbi:MAG: glycosyltransferase family 39 protein [Anaerolineales bacterium]|nr:MAG: glycosyltransferase family 39 protein [Anaerolineales bacterium]